MNNTGKMKHARELPTARSIRRTCSRELYRARKKLGGWISPDAVQEGEKLYYQKVMLNLIWIAENGSNRKLLCDWWDENVLSELAALWNVDEAALARAFRDSFGG